MTGYLVPVVRFEKASRKSNQKRRARQQRNQAAAGPQVPPELAGQAQRDLRALEAAEAGHSHPAFQRKQPVTATPPAAAVNHATTPASAARALTTRRLAMGGGVAAGVGAAGAGGYLVHRQAKKRKQLVGLGKADEVGERRAAKEVERKAKVKAFLNRPDISSQIDEVFRPEPHKSFSDHVGGGVHVNYRRPDGSVTSPRPRAVRGLNAAERKVSRSAGKGALLTGATVLGTGVAVAQHAKWRRQARKSVKKDLSPKAKVGAIAAGAGLAGGGIAIHNKRTTGRYGGLASKEGLKPTLTPKAQREARQRYLQMVEEHQRSRRT